MHCWMSSAWTAELLRLRRFQHVLVKNSEAKLSLLFHWRFFCCPKGRSNSSRTSGSGTIPMSERRRKRKMGKSIDAEFEEALKSQGLKVKQRMEAIERGQKPTAITGNRYLDSFLVMPPKMTVSLRGRRLVVPINLVPFGLLCIVFTIFCWTMKLKGYEPVWVDISRRKVAQALMFVKLPAPASWKELVKDEEDNEVEEG